MHSTQCGELKFKSGEWKGEWLPDPLWLKIVKHLSSLRMLYLSATAPQLLKMHQVLIFIIFIFTGRKTLYVVWVCGTCKGLFKDNVANASTETSLNLWL